MISSSRHTAPMPGAAGAAPRREPGQWRVLLLLLALGGSTSDFVRRAEGATVPVTDVALTLPAVTASPPTAAKPKLSGWHYFESVNLLDGDVTHHARLPANPPGGGMLDVSSSGKYGTRILIVFPRVRTDCDGAACQMRLAWDGAAPAPYPYQDLSGDAETTLQPLDSDRFLGAMATACDLTLTAAFGTPRDHVLTFTVAGFDPAMLRQAAGQNVEN